MACLIVALMMLTTCIGRTVVERNEDFEDLLDLLMNKRCGNPGDSCNSDSDCCGNGVFGVERIGCGGGV